MATNDGYNLPGKIPAFGPFPAINFTYRPALYGQVAEWQNKQRGADAARLTDNLVALLTGNLISWDKDGGATPCAEAAWRKLTHPEADCIVDHITRYAFTPDETKPSQAEADAKNSPTG
jgi:hypothetical protein